MLVERWTGPPVETHTYLLYDPDTDEAWSVDAPLETAELVLARVKEQGLTLRRAVLTHGHFDHVLDAEVYQNAGIPIAACPVEAAMLAAPQTALFGLPYPMPEVRIDEELTEGGKLSLGAHEWEIWQTPGHSPGHVVLYCAALDLLVGGDMLFQDGYGRTDLPMCDPAAMNRSLRRLLQLPDRTRVLPGHGPETTIGRERRWLEPMVG